VVLELDALTNADKIFLIEALLLWIHHYRLADGKREQFKHAIFIEEAHHILLRKKQEVTGEETVTDVLLWEIRELGESVICLDQHPSLISKPALGNTYTTFAFNFSQGTIHGYKVTLKRFYRWLEGDDEEYPRKVRWIKTNGDTMRIQEPEQLLTFEEIVETFINLYCLAILTSTKAAL
jgi:hypothetical protein